MADDTVLFNITIAVKKEIIDNALADAFEGGSNYWSGKVIVNEWPEGAEYASDVPMLGGTIQVPEVDDYETKLHLLNQAIIRHGLEVMSQKYPSYFGDLLGMEEGGKYDAITADVFLQCCLFGDVIYG